MAAGIYDFNGFYVFYVFYDFYIVQTKWTLDDLLEISIYKPYEDRRGIEFTGAILDVKSEEL